jgi:hypothetical protein
MNILLNNLSAVWRGTENSSEDHIQKSTHDVACAAKTMINCTNNNNFNCMLWNVEKTTFYI